MHATGKQRCDSRRTCSCPASSIHGTRNRICRRRQERRGNRSRRMHMQGCTCKVLGHAAHRCRSKKTCLPASPAAPARTAGQTPAAAPAAAQTRAATKTICRAGGTHQAATRQCHVPGCAVLPAALLHLSSRSTPHGMHHKLLPTCIEAATSLTAARNSGWSGSRSLTPSSTRLSPGCSMPSSQSSCIRLGERGEGSCRRGSGAGRVGRARRQLQGRRSWR